MGAVSRVDRIEGATAEEALLAAQSEARSVFGSGGYTGSVAEADGMRFFTFRPEGITHAEAVVLSDLAEKWGPAFVSPVLDERFVVKRGEGL